MKECADAVCQHEEEEFEFKAFACHRMNVLGQESFQERARRFHHFSLMLLNELDISRKRPFGIFLSQGHQMDATGLFKEILKGVVIIGFIGVNGAAFL